MIRRWMALGWLARIEDEVVSLRTSALTAIQDRDDYLAEHGQTSQFELWRAARHNHDLQHHYPRRATR